MRRMLFCVAINLTTYIDSKPMDELLAIVDPVNMLPQLARCARVDSGPTLPTWPVPKKYKHKTWRRVSHGLRPVT